jgi:hypothetical protein
MTDRIIKEHLSKEGVEFIQQACKQEEDLIGEAVWTVKQLTPEEIEEFKAITPQQWVDMMRPLFSTPYFGDEMKDIFVTEEVRKEILEWATEYEDNKD